MTASAGKTVSQARKKYLLFLLGIILAFNCADRWALGVLLQNIKADLHLTDTQLGFLGGIAFALFYSIMGIPIARWADRGNRVTIIAVSTAMWSVAVALCGLAANFAQLLLIRVAVAVGEAGCVPPAHSLIADYFTRTERPKALGRYLLAIPLSLTIGYFGAGWLNELLGWRVTLAVLGLAGVIPAVLAWVTLTEPRQFKRGRTEGGLFSGGRSTTEPTLREVITALWSKRAFRHLFICFSLWYFFGYGLQQWQPAFFTRSHGLSSGEVGTWLAVIYGVGSGLGIYLGGELAARYAANNERLQLAMSGMLFAAAGVLQICVYLAPSKHLALGILAVEAFLGTSAQGPILATLQTLVPARMRAMSIALVYLFANLVGLGFGPLTAGALSDALQPWFGQDSLRYSLVILCPGYLWAGWHLWRASRTVGDDVAGTESEDESNPTTSMTPVRTAGAECS